MPRRDCQLVLPRSPKVQNTSDESATSSAKYCSSVVAPVSMELMATPASTMPSEETCLNRLRPRMTAATSSEPRNEHSGMAQLPVCVRPRPMMATAAPNVAPCDTPSVEAEASGLRSTACRMQPASPSPAPETMAVQMRGRRLLRMTRLILLSAARPKMPRMSSAAGVLYDPARSDKKNASASTAARRIRKRMLLARMRV